MITMKSKYCSGHGLSSLSGSPSPAIYIELAWACPQLGVNDSQPSQVGIMDKCYEFGGNPSETMIMAFLW